jgi:hypothetical protein
VSETLRNSLLSIGAWHFSLLRCDCFSRFDIQSLHCRKRKAPQWCTSTRKVCLLVSFSNCLKALPISFYHRHSSTYVLLLVTESLHYRVRTHAHKNVVMWR